MGGKVIAVSDKTLWLWDRGGQARKIGDGFFAVKRCLSRSGERLAVAKPDASVEVWDISTVQQM